MGFGSKNKKKGSKKGDKDKKNKKKSKSSSNLKGKDKKGHDKKDKHHAKKGPAHGGGPPPPKVHGPPKPVKRAPGHGGGEMIARTPPHDANGHWQPPQQQQQGRPNPMQQQPPGAARPQPGQQQQQQQRQQQPGPPQQQQPPRPPPPQPGSGGPQGNAVVRSQSLSAESMGLQQQQQLQQKQRPQQQQPAVPRPAPGPPAARPPQQLQQQRPLPAQPPLSPQQIRPGQPSPDMEKTEKKSGKKIGGAGNKISKFLDIKFSAVIEAHRKNTGTLPNSVSRAAFDDNLCLNRFEDVICIDQTRVLFSDTSLYLNANWVVIEPGKKPEDPPKKMAIVAQLPLPECAVAFWSMIAENDIKGVLLFCDDNEFLTFEADKIFPVNKATVAISPHITVTHTHRLAVSAEWTMNVYLMCRGDVRKYIHVHCYAWAGDDQIKLNNLWQLESVFRKYSSPHVYMSSAGVGRASTFAALKMVHARMHDESCKEVNLNNCIVSLREHRLHSIQARAESTTQSITLHSALIQHIIDCPLFEKYETDPRVRTFAEQFKEHMATASKDWEKS